MNNRKLSWAAAFLMATSAIGPGFLTQTTVLTQQLRYSFVFGIILSVIIDLVAQLSIWRVLGFSNLRLRPFGNRILPFAGDVLICMIVMGAFIFNIGNVAGTGIGLATIFGITTEMGAAISFGFIFILFAFPKSQFYIDLVVKGLGLGMIVLILILVCKVEVDYSRLFKNIFLPEKVDFKAILTLVGGTVGGYITFAGIHRILDSESKFSEKEIDQAAFRGILITAILRVCLFIGTLGILNSGITLSLQNPTASVFQSAFDEKGNVLFGLMIWFAAMTSVIGATYTSLAIIGHSTFIERQRKPISIMFVFLSLVIYLFYGKPVQILLWAGYINVFVLPLTLLLILVGLKSLKSLGYRHATWLKYAGFFVLFLLIYFSIFPLIS